MILKFIFAWLIGTGVVQPMNDSNDDRELYYLYIFENDKIVYVYEHAYKEEILNYYFTGDFEYNEALTEKDIVQNN
tara:strand:- start:66 stop:293 length:228 start_codon:yes stop_codon:yes gene_type:complete